ncbi:MAG: hypothetical protein GY796_10610 [Chloroflexi bacterium]|nr:hypothetical protein [Chloroflexota bacterium]
MEMARLFIGGRGLGARLLWDLVGPDVEPLSPENVLIFITGPIEVTVIGNALMQFITLGEIKDIEEGRHIVAHMAAQERYNPDWTPDCQPTLSS